MQPRASGISNRFDKHLERLRDHRTLGPPIRLYFRRREQFFYLLVGAWNTVFGYGMWALLHSLLNGYVNYLVIVVLAWPIAVLNAYFGYRLIVFRSRGSVLRELPRFSLIYVAALVANLVLLPVALRLMPFNIYVVQAVLTAVVVIGGYLGHKYYSFRDGQHQDAARGSISDTPDRSQD